MDKYTQLNVSWHDNQHRHHIGQCTDQHIDMLRKLDDRDILSLLDIHPSEKTVIFTFQFKKLSCKNLLLHNYSKNYQYILVNMCKQDVPFQTYQNLGYIEH